MKKTIFILFAFLGIFLEKVAGKFGLIHFSPEGENVKITFNEQTYEVSKADFAKAVETGTLAVKDDNAMIFTKSDYETRHANLEKEHYGKGKTAGVEMLAKEIKKKRGLEDVDGKDIDSLFDIYAERKIKEAKVPESEKVKEHEITIAKLRENLTKKEQRELELTKEVENVKNSYTQKEQQLIINHELSRMVPEKAVSETLSRQDIISLFRGNGYDAKIIDDPKNKDKSIMVATKNGDVVKHDVTLEPLPLEDVLLKFVTDKKLIEVKGGRGEGDATKTAANSYEAFEKEMIDKGITPGSARRTRRPPPTPSATSKSASLVPLHR